MQTHDDDPPAQAGGGPAPVAVDIRTAYEQLLDIARVHGRDELKHLTRAYQAIAPHGGGRIEQLSFLID